jgi:hypothetical protein
MDTVYDADGFDKNGHDKNGYNDKGLFRGVKLDRLSALEGGEERFIQSEPYGTLDEVGGRGKAPYYGLRLAYCPDHARCRPNSWRQALVKAPDDTPIWINLYPEKI